MDRSLRHQPPRSLVGFPLWMALVGGSVEVCVLYGEKRSQPLMHLSHDFVWMAPLALLAVVSLCVAPVLVMPRLARTLSVFAAASIVFLDLFLLVPRLEPYAAAVLAAGLAVQTTRVALRRPADVQRLVQRSTLGVVAFLAVSVGLMWFSLHTADRVPSAPASTSAQHPNVLLITLDAVRAANLSLYGYVRRTTPNIDRFAERGVVFETAFPTAPWTLPSHASIFTGRWPHELSADYTSPLDGTYPTLAEYLGARGYATGGFVANLGYCGSDTGLGRGFQHYEDYPRSLGTFASSSTLVRKVADNFKLRRLIQNDQHLDRVVAEDLNARAMAWLATRAGTPFFMFLNYFDAHEPYLPPPPFDRQFGPGRPMGRYSPLHHWLWDPVVAHGNMGKAEREEEIDGYDGALAYLDRTVGALLQGLERQGVLENTLVVITADHGEEFLEHGVYEHGYSLYRYGLQVPLVVVMPGRAPAARRIMTPVSLRDLPTTVVEMVGISDGSPFPGRTLTRFWSSATTAPDAQGPILSEVSRARGQPNWFPASKGDMKAVLHQGMRYIRNGDGSEELYDLAADVEERHNLAMLPERQQVLLEGRARLNELRGHADRPPAVR